MEFDCQSFVDLGEVFGGGEEVSPLAWLPCSPLNASGRRRSVSSIGSRPREPLSRCPSVETDDDSVFLDPPPPTPSKAPLEPRTSLGNIKEVRESSEDLQQSSTSPRQLGSPSTVPSASLSGSSGNSGSSSCSSSDSSGPVTTPAKFMKRANTWQYGLIAKTPTEENNGYALVDVEYTSVCILVYCLSNHLHSAEGFTSFMLWQYIESYDRTQVCLSHMLFSVGGHCVEAGRAVDSSCRVTSL